MKKPLTNSQFARVLLLLATAAWGMSFPIVKAIRGQFYCAAGASELAQSASFVFLRFAVTSLIFGAWVFGRKKEKGRSNRLSRGEVLLGAALGIFGSFGLLFQTDGMAYTDAATSSFLTQMTCVLVPLISLVRRRRAITPLFAIAMIAGLGGLYFISGFDIRRFRLGRGEAETILAAIFFTAQILVLEGRRFRKFATLKCTAVMFAVFALGNLPFFHLGDLCVRALPVQHALAPLFFFAVLVLACSLLPYAIMNSWQPVISATEATFIYSLEAVFTLFFNFLWIPLLVGAGYVMSLDRPSLGFSVGAFLLILANIVLFYEAVGEEKKLS